MNIKNKLVALLALAAFVLPGVSMAAISPTTAQLQAEIATLSAQLQVLEAELMAQTVTTSTPIVPPKLPTICPAWGCNAPVPVPTSTPITIGTPSVTVVWPNGGELLNDNGASNLGTIKWTTTNFGSLNIEIDLLDDSGNLMKAIATNIPNTGSYVWATDPTIPNGNYKISISSADKGPSASDNSNGFFQITGSPLGTAANPSLIVEEPVPGDGYTAGQPMAIAWNEGGVAPKNVQIFLQNSVSGAMTTLASLGASTVSSWEGNTPSNTPAGSNYTVIVCDEGIPSPVASAKPLCGHVSSVSVAPPLNVVSNPAFTSGNVLVGAVGAKIGSYIISAPNAEALQLKTVSITEGTNAADFQNFRVLVNGVQFGTTYASSNMFQSFSGNVVLPANGSATVDVLADVLSNTPAGTQNTTEIYAYGVGQTSGAPYTSSGESVTGQTMTVVSMQTATPSITVLSPNKGDLWQLGHTETVKWSSVGMNNISLYVHFSDGGMCFIATRPAAAGTYSFALLPTCSNISSLITPGQYTISLWGDNASTSLYSVHVDSAPFSIVAPSSSFAGGVLTAALSASTPQASYLGMGATGVNVAQYQFTADANSNENLTQLNITDRSSVSAATASTDHATFLNYRLTDASGNVLAAGVEGANGTIQFNLSSLIIPANSTALVNVVADVNSYPYATSGATHAFALASFNYGNPVAANTQIVTSNNVGNLFTVYQTTLNATGASFANPSSVSAVGNTVGAFTFTAGYGSKSPIVKSITLSTNGSVIQGSTAQTLGLYDASNPSVLLGSATMAGTSNAVFSISGNQWMIPPGSSKTLLVKVLSAPTNLASMTNGATGNYQVLLQGVTWTDEVTANISSLSPNISMPIASQNITGLSTTASAPVISQVQNLTATTGSGSVNLSWSAATATNGVMQYLIYRSTVSGFTPSESNRIAEGNVLSYTDSSLAPGTYYYTVAAMDMKSVLGPASAQVGATVANAIIIAPRPIAPIKVAPLQSSASDASNQTAIISQSIQNLLSQLSGLLKSL